MWPFRRPKPPPKKSDVLATQVRVKSITRPLTKQGGSPPPIAMPSQESAIELALQQLLRTNRWSDTLKILELQAPLLLTDEAQTLLRRYIREVRESGAPEAVNIAMYLEAHRLLLERARVVGIQRAWDEFLAIRPAPEKESARAAPSDAQVTMDAVRELLGTETWSDTLNQLIQHQSQLLTDSADQLITALIQLAMQETSPDAIESIKYLELHRALLRDARSIGIDRAWSNFESARSVLNQHRDRDRDAAHGVPPSNQGAMPNPAAVSEALRVLLTTPNWDSTRTYLEMQQGLLLTDLCDLFISQLIAASESDPDPRARRGVVYLELHRRLLRRARREGIPHAWDQFERELLETQQSMSNEQDDGRPSMLHGDTVDLAAANRAIRELISAPSLRQELVVVEARRGVLLTEAAITILSDEADKMERRGTQRDVMAVQILRLQVQLLVRSREVGLEQAWKEYVAARGE